MSDVESVAESVKEGMPESMESIFANKDLTDRKQ
jgi:hypothetical protein